MLAYSTFPRPQGSEYHRANALSLLCSEWEEVGHALVKHQQIKILEELAAFPFGLRSTRGDGEGLRVFGLVFWTKNISAVFLNSNKYCGYMDMPHKRAIAS